MINKVYRTEENEDQQIVEEKRLELNDSLENTSEQVPSSFTVLFDEKYRRVTWICIIMAVINQFDGVNVMNFYSNSIFKDIFENDGDQAAVIGSICVGVA